MFVFVVLVIGYWSLDFSNRLITDAEIQQPNLQKAAEFNSPEQLRYEVASVIDGDTLRVYIDGQIETVRVLGIDTPETKYSQNGEECYATQATAQARQLLENQMISLLSDPTQAQFDKYDRLLAYISLPNGQDFGEQMLLNGYAREYTFINSYQKQRLYQAAQAQAQNNKLGLWGCE